MLQTSEQDYLLHGAQVDSFYFLYVRKECSCIIYSSICLLHEVPVNISRLCALPPSEAEMYMVISSKIWKASCDPAGLQFFFMHWGFRNRETKHVIMSQEKWDTRNKQHYKDYSLLCVNKIHPPEKLISYIILKVRQIIAPKVAQEWFYNLNM